MCREWLWELRRKGKYRDTYRHLQNIFGGDTDVAFTQALWESIPKEHRPELDESDAGRPVGLIFSGGDMTTLGSVNFPFILRDMETGERMRYVLRAYVVPRLLIPMFIGGFDPRGVVEGFRSGREGFVFTFKCRDGTCLIKGQ